MDKLKAYIVYGGSHQWYTCTLIAENGWAIAQHICSHPNFAAGDLWFSRPERAEAMKKIGIDLDVQPGLIHDPDLEKTLPGLIAKNKDDSFWKELAQRYSDAFKPGEETGSGPAGVQVHTCGDGSLESALENGGVDA